MSTTARANSRGRFVVVMRVVVLFVVRLRSMRVSRFPPPPMVLGHVGQVIKCVGFVHLGQVGHVPQVGLGQVRHVGQVGAWCGVSHVGYVSVRK